MYAPDTVATQHSLGTSCSARCRLAVFTLAPFHPKSPSTCFPKGPMMYLTRNGVKTHPPLHALRLFSSQLVCLFQGTPQSKYQERSTLKQRQARNEPPTNRPMATHLGPATLPPPPSPLACTKFSWPCRSTLSCVPRESRAKVPLHPFALVPWKQMKICPVVIDSF